MNSEVFEIYVNSEFWWNYYWKFETEKLGGKFSMYSFPFFNQSSLKMIDILQGAEFYIEDV